MDDLAKIGVMNGNSPYFDNLFMVAMFGITTWYQQRIMTPPGVLEDPQQAAMQRSMGGDARDHYCHVFVFPRAVGRLCLSGDLQSDHHRPDRL